MKTLLARLHSYEPIIRLILALMYITGLVGLHMSASEDLFRLLVPFHLLTTGVLLLLFQESPTRSFWLFCLSIFLMGYGVEVAGVHTGVIFGEYWYGATLGLKVFEVPLTIGLNWLVLTIGAGMLWQERPLPRAIRATLAAACMVFLDVLLEPVAIRFDFWHWKNEQIPLQNFLAWALVAWVFCLLFQFVHFPKMNRLAAYLFVLQVLFFATHRLLLLLQ